MVVVPVPASVSLLSVVGRLHETRVCSVSLCVCNPVTLSFTFSVCSVLVIHLKRFRVTPKWEWEKTNELVLLNRELLVCPGPAGDAAASQKREGAPGQVSNQDQVEPGSTLPLATGSYRTVVLLCSCAAV